VDSDDSTLTEALPPVKAMTARALASADRESDEPEDEEYGSRYPQQMHREPSSEENQDKQQCQNQYHGNTSLFLR
jgi:hypothetical protein